RLRRPFAPGSIETAARGTPSASASARTQAALARPSTGGSRTATRSASPCTPPTPARAARGWTWIQNETAPGRRRTSRPAASALTRAGPAGSRSAGLRGRGGRRAGRAAAAAPRGRLRGGLGEEGDLAVEHRIVGQLRGEPVEDREVRLDRAAHGGGEPRAQRAHLADV